jgi:hypothetical protein
MDASVYSLAMDDQEEFRLLHINKAGTVEQTLTGFQESLATGA